MRHEELALTAHEVTQENADLYSQIDSLREALAAAERDVERLRERVGPIDPGGSDRVDELESAIGNLHHRIITLTAERDGWQKSAESLTENVKRWQDECDKLTAERDAVQTERDAWHTAFGTTQLTHSTARLEKAEDACKRLQYERDGSVWMWQGDGEDHLESLTCPILIWPAQLSALTAERDAAVDSLRFAAGYKGIEGRACPLCTYVDGKFVSQCQMHTDMETCEPNGTRR